MKQELTEIRNELYNELPVGEISAWELVRVIKKHLTKLDILLAQEEYAAQSPMRWVGCNIQPTNETYCKGRNINSDGLVSLYWDKEEWYVLYPNDGNEIRLMPEEYCNYVWCFAKAGILTTKFN